MKLKEVKFYTKKWQTIDGTIDSRLFPIVETIDSDDSAVPSIVSIVPSIVCHLYYIEKLPVKKVLGYYDDKLMMIFSKTCCKVMHIP